MRKKKAAKSRRPWDAQPPASFRERERLRLRIAQDKRLLGECDGTPDHIRGLDREMHLPSSNVGSVNRDAIVRRIKRQERALERLGGQHAALTDRERNKLYREYKGLCKELKKRMLSTYDMGYYPKTDHEKHQNYLRAVDKSVESEMTPETQGMMRRAKTIARLVAPDDPNLANLELLRSRHRH